MPKAGSRKRIRNPDDNNQYIDLRLVDELTLKHGSGPIYQKRITTFLNADQDHPTSRKVHSKTITHKAQGLADGSPSLDAGDADDPTQRLEIEIIEEFTTRHGSGPVFQKNIHVLEEDKDKSGRKTHRVRIRGTSKGRSQDSWIDVERTDELTLKHGSGPIFRREIIVLDWNDNEFDNADVDLIDDSPANRFDPPVRSDPFQTIVNVKWAAPTLVGFNMTWSYTFAHSEDVVLGPPCTPITSGNPDQPVYTSGTSDYSFPLDSGRPTFFSGNSLITTSNTTVSGEPTAPSGASESMCVGFNLASPDDVINEVVDSLDVPMLKAILSGSPVCYNDGSDVTGHEGILAHREDFTVNFSAGNISATLLGKAQDTRTITFLNTQGSTITIVVGFVWSIPAGFDLSGPGPLP